MRICYLDESGVPELSGGTSHFVFLGLSIQAETWRVKDEEITRLKRRFGLERAEVHTGWLARRYPEQESIRDFETRSEAERRRAVQEARDALLIRKAATRGVRSVEEDRKNFRKTAPYIHLTLQERREFLRQLADALGGWQDCHLFAEATDKTAFGGVPPQTPPFEEGFTQVVTRFHRFLEQLQPPEYGLLVEDHNETMARRLTDLMRRFHAQGTRWTPLPLIVETPLFVDSGLTSLVQMADLCAYAIRRYCEKAETDLFDRVLPRFHTSGGRLVGIRHYTAQRRCACAICRRH